MRRYALTRRAQTDLYEIALYIAHDNPPAADRLLRQLRQHCRLLASSPGIGRRRPELGHTVRSLPCGHFIFFYQPAELGVIIIRILHAARDIRPLIV